MAISSLSFQGSFWIYPSQSEADRNALIPSLEETYWGLGHDNKWIESVDGCFRHLGKDVFDQGKHGGPREPGFIASMENAYLFAAKNLGQIVDPDWYLELHQHTCAHFTGDRDITEVGHEGVGVFRNISHLVSAVCKLGQVYEPSREALVEFRSLHERVSTHFREPGYGLGEWVQAVHLETNQQVWVVEYQEMTEAQVENVFNLFLSEFYEEIKNAVTPDEKLTAIARLHQRLEWLHPVADGTSRTSLVLMNLLLTNYGFNPALLEYPHVSTSYSLVAWTAYLKKGVESWLARKAELDSVL